MKKIQLVKSIFVLTCVMILPLAAHAVDTPKEQVAPDNSEVNIRDRNPAELTADQGGNQESDRTIMQNIRKNILADKSMSSSAYNAKVIAVDGKVTLKGVVRSQEESDSLQKKAVDVVGATNVTNELSVMNAR